MMTLIYSQYLWVNLKLKRDELDAIWKVFAKNKQNLVSCKKEPKLKWTGQVNALNIKETLIYEDN